MKRIPFTERAKRIALRQLEEWNEQGYDVSYILDESTLKGWRGLFVSERTPRIPQQPRQYTAEQVAHITNINRAIEESERTGQPVDTILAELRARA